MNFDLDRRIDYICSANVYDNLFKFVRCRIREGKTNQQIQEEINGMWNDFHIYRP